MAKAFVIAGHGAGDPGACANGYREADQVRKLAARMQALGGSEVIVGDMNRNWYKDNGIGRGHCPKGVPVIELHMDSAGAGAKGGHVIIKDGFSPDAIDNALAAFIGGFFPGRSKTIVGRSDLANPNRAARAGVNYRLVECGFISDAGDAQKFDSQMDELAKGILAAFGIGASAPAPAPAPAPQPAPSWSCGPLGSDLSMWGPLFTRELQRQRGTVVDGVISGQPRANAKYFWAVEDATRRFGSSGSDLIRSIQGLVGVTADGYYGPASIKAHQRWLNAKVGAGLAVDGYHGKATNRAMATAMQRGLYR